MYKYIIILINISFLSLIMSKVDQLWDSEPPVSSEILSPISKLVRVCRNAMPKLANDPLDTELPFVHSNTGFWVKPKLIFWEWIGNPEYSDNMRSWDREGHKRAFETANQKVPIQSAHQKTPRWVEAYLRAYYNKEIILNGIAAYTDCGFPEYIYWFTSIESNASV